MPKRPKAVSDGKKRVRPSFTKLSEPSNQESAPKRRTVGKNLSDDGSKEDGEGKGCDDANAKRRDGGKSRNSGDPATTGNFCVIAGSYERILYGLDGRWAGSKDDQTEPTLRLEPVFIFPAHTGCIKAVAVGGRYLASGSTDEVVKLYDLKKRKELGSLLQHNGSVTAIQFFGSTHMLSGSEDGTLCIWRTRGWECLRVMRGHKGRINALAIHPSGKIALSVASDRVVQLWNLLTGQRASAIKIGKEGEVVLWNAAGDQYAILTTNEILIYDVADAKVKQRIQQRSRFHCMRYFTNDEVGEIIVAGNEDGAMRFYTTDDGKCIVTLKSHKSRVRAIDVIRSVPLDSTKPVVLLVSVSSDGIVNVWNTSSILNLVHDGCADTERAAPLVSYDAKDRLTCVSVSPGFGWEQHTEQNMKDVLEHGARLDDSK